MTSEMMTMGTVTSLTSETFSPAQSEAFVASFCVRFKCPRSGIKALGPSRIRVSRRHPGRASPGLKAVTEA